MTSFLLRRKLEKMYRKIFLYVIPSGVVVFQETFSMSVRAGGENHEKIMRKSKELWRESWCLGFLVSKCLVVCVGFIGFLVPKFQSFRNLQKNNFVLPVRY